LSISIRLEREQWEVDSICMRVCGVCCV